VLPVEVLIGQALAHANVDLCDQDLSVGIRDDLSLGRWRLVTAGARRQPRRKAAGKQCHHHEQYTRDSHRQTPLNTKNRMRPEMVAAYWRSKGQNLVNRCFAFTVNRTLFHLRAATQLMKWPNNAVSG